MEDESLTVSFVQRGLKQVQLIQDEVASECKFPDFHKAICDIARRSLRLLTAPDSTLLADAKQLHSDVRKLCPVLTSPAKLSADCKKAGELERIAMELASRGEGVGLMSTVTAR